MKETNIYTGGKNPNRRNSYNGKIRYQKWEQEKNGRWRTLVGTSFKII